MTWLLLVPVLLAGALRPAQTGQLVERYGRAQTAIAEQDYSQAVNILQSLVREFGGSYFGDELRFSLAEAYFNAGEYERSRDMFRRIGDGSRLDYIRPEALYGEAKALIMLGQYDLARTRLEALGQHRGYERDERTSFAFGLLHFHLGEYEQAISRLTGLTLPTARFYLARAQTIQGRPLPALQALNNMIAEAPDSPMAQMAHFAAGEALFRNQDYDGARVKFQFFVERFSNSPLADYAYYYLGCALLARRQHAEAIRYLALLANHPDEYLAAHANYFIGYALMEHGHPAEAAERYQYVRAGFPNTRIAGFANVRLAEAMLATADTTQALLTTSQLSQLLQTGDMSGAGSYFSGVILIQAGMHLDAARQFEQVLAAHGRTALREPAAAMMLLAYNTALRYDQAVTLGTRYIADFPTEPDEWRARTLYLLAEALYYQGSYGEADVYYQQTYTHSPEGDVAPNARLSRCFSLYHLGRLTEAAQGFEALRDTRPADTVFTVSAYLGSGYTAFNQREYHRALDFFEALTTTYPNYAPAAIPAYFHAGYCYYQLGYYGDAIDTWTRLINRFPEQDPKAAEAAFRTGETYYRATDYGNAIAMLTFVIERHPGSEFAPLAQALIARCYADRNMHRDAAREYRKFIELYPADPQEQGVREQLKNALLLDGSLEALAELERAFPGSDELARAWYDRGEAFFAARRYDEAAFEFQKVVVNAPSSPLAGDAQLLTAESHAEQKRWTDAANAYHKFVTWFPDHSQLAGAWFMLGTARFNAGNYQGSVEAFSAVADNYPDSEYAESARQNIAIGRQRLGPEASQLPDETESTSEPATEPEAGDGDNDVPPTDPPAEHEDGSIEPPVRESDEDEAAAPPAPEADEGADNDADDPTPETEGEQ